MPPWPAGYHNHCREIRVLGGRAPHTHTSVPASPAVNPIPDHEYLTTTQHKHSGMQPQGGRVGGSGTVKGSFPLDPLQILHPPSHPSHLHHMLHKSYAGDPHRIPTQLPLGRDAASCRGEGHRRQAEHCALPSRQRGIQEKRKGHNGLRRTTERASFLSILTLYISTHKTSRQVTCDLMCGNAYHCAGWNIPMSRVSLPPTLPPSSSDCYTPSHWSLAMQ